MKEFCSSSENWGNPFGEDNQPPSRFASDLALALVGSQSDERPGCDRAVVKPCRVVAVRIAL